MMTQYCNLVLVAIVWTLCGNVMAGPVEDKWGAPLAGPIGLKQYIVSILYMQNQSDFGDQQRNVSKPTAEFLNDIEVAPILYAFDSFQSKRDINDLASLSAYYLGEANGVLYRCLVLRKGSKIMSALESLTANPSNECISRFGSEGKMCIEDKQYRDTLKYYINTISTLTKAHSTEPGCTTEGWSKM